EAKAKRLRLAQTIHDSSGELIALSSRIDWKDYHSIVGDSYMKAIMYHPYLLCFYGVISLALEYAEHETTGSRVAFVLDTETNGTLDDDAKMQYDLTLAKSSGIRDSLKARMGSVTQDSDI